MRHEEKAEIARLRASEGRAHSENEQFRAEIEHLVESRRSTEDTLARYVEFYDHAPLALLTLDNLGTIQDLNLAAAALLGTGTTERAALMGQRLRRFVVDEDRETLVEHLRRCEGADAPVSCELHLRGRHGHPLLVALSSRQPRSDVRSYASAIVDLTESRRNTVDIEQLVEAEKTARVASEAKDQFIAVLSHELRTPLTPVLAATSALAERTDLDPRLRSMCEMIRRNVITEARLIDDLLDVSRIVRGKMDLHRELVDVHELATEAVGMVREEARSKEITLIEALEAKRHWAFADSIRMRQVFWNLLRNAVKFTPERGRVELRSWNNDGNLAVEVSDTGVGFDEATAPRLFKAFEQDESALHRFGGLGLGLAICQGVVDLHGGTITANSPGPDKGARFIVQIESVLAPGVGVGRPKPIGSPPSDAPLARVLSLPPAPKMEDAPATSTRLRILLVEDDPDTGDMLHELLTDAGYDVRIVRSARAALAEKLERIDLLLSDIGLPDGSGLDLMRVLRDRRAIKGIALSGYGTEADVRASREAGFEAHLTKPIEVNGLLEVIDKVAATI